VLFAHFRLANFPAPSGDYHPVRGWQRMRWVLHRSL